MLRVNHNLLKRWQGPAANRLRRCLSIRTSCAQMLQSASSWLRGTLHGSALHTPMPVPITPLTTTTRAAQVVAHTWDGSYRRWVTATSFSTHDEREQRAGVRLRVGTWPVRVSRCAGAAANS